MFILPESNGSSRACTIADFDGSLVSNSKGHIKCKSLNNRPYQARLALVNINSNKPFYYLFTVSVNECNGSCNIIVDHVLEYVF